LDVFEMKKIGLPEILILCVIASASGVFGGFLGGTLLAKANDSRLAQLQP